VEAEDSDLGVNLVTVSNPPLVVDFVPAEELRYGVWQEVDDAARERGDSREH